VSSGPDGTGQRVLLLRGVNLGARNKVPMARLRELLGAEGFGGVRSYVQSGNVLVDDDGSPADAVGERVAALVLEHFGVASPCLVRSAAQLRATVAVAARPDAPPVPADPRFYTVVFLAGVADRRLLAGVDPADHDEQFLVVGDEVHVSTPQGARNARLSHAFWEKRLGLTATARNWRTVTTLAEMAGSPG
jgi:uncharacterized protein (DUF1697 family)